MKKRTTPVKKGKSSTPENKLEIGYKWFDYRNMLTGLDSPMSIKGLEKMAQELVIWAKEDANALKVSQFYLDKGINTNTWAKWCNDYDFFREAHGYAKMIIGNRREAGAVNNKFNAGIVSYTMPIYDPEWKEETVRRASLKDGSNEAKTTITVLTSPIPNSYLVPERKKDE
jgi:hypothetical protein